MDTKELLEEHLNKICWSLRGCGCGHYLLHDHNGDPTQYMLFGSSITNKDENTVSEFYVKPETIKIIDSNSVCVGTDDSFVLFMNHDMVK